MSDQTGSAQPTESSASVEQQDDKVAYATYKRVLSEAKKYKELAETLSKQTEQEREKKLKEQNEWKTIAELNQQKLDQAQKELEEKNRAIQDGLKFSEFQRHLGGKLKHDSYANHIDFDKIVINPETGRVDEGSVKQVVNEFVKVHSHLVDFGQKGKLPNQAPQGGAPGSKSPDEMTKQELEQHILNLARAGKIK
jgi:hypothetical protein